MPPCKCLEAGECPMELIPDCAACDGFSTTGYMAAMAYRLEERVEAIEFALKGHVAIPVDWIRQYEQRVAALEVLRDRLEALYGLWDAGGPEPAAPEQAAQPEQQPREGGSP